MKHLMPLLLMGTIMFVVLFSLTTTTRQVSVNGISQDDFRVDPILLAPESNFWSERLFNHGLVQNYGNREEELGLWGGVIPHHQVGSRLIHDLLRRFPKTTKRVIFLIPDHYRLTDSSAYTTAYSWQTPFGVVVNDHQVVGNLSTNPFVEHKDTEDVFQEHALGGMMPYFKYHLANAQIVPVVFNNKASQEALDSIIRDLHPYVDDSTIVIASIDFSHNLPLVISQERDQHTWQAIQDQDWSELFKLSDEYLDSPAALYVAHQLMTTKGAATPVLIDKGNAITELEQSDNLGTSYLEIGWYQSNHQKI